MLENYGQVMLELRNDRRVKPIGQHGQATFAEIPAKFFGREQRLSLKAEGYQLTEGEKRFTLDGEPVYLELQSAAASAA